MKNLTLPFAYFACLALLCGVGTQLAANPTGSAKVLAVEGTATAYDEGSTQGMPLSRGDILEQGVGISTSALSSVDLVFSNGSTLTVEENTSLTLTELQQQAYGGTATYEDLQADPSQSQTLLDLNYGSTRGEIKNLRPGSTFDINTPLGTAAIRGTIVRVELRYNAEREEFILDIFNEGGDVDILSKYLGRLEFGAGNVGDKGYDSSLSDVTAEPIPGGHRVIIRLSRQDPYFDDLIDRLSNVAPFKNSYNFPPTGPDDPKSPKGGPPAPEFTPDDPSTQVVSPEGPENGNGPSPD